MTDSSRCHDRNIKLLEFFLHSVSTCSSHENCILSSGTDLLIGKRKANKSQNLNKKCLLVFFCVWTYYAQLLEEKRNKGLIWINPTVNWVKQRHEPKQGLFWCPPSLADYNQIWSALFEYITKASCMPVKSSINLHLSSAFNIQTMTPTTACLPDYIFPALKPDDAPPDHGHQNRSPSYSLSLSFIFSFTFSLSLSLSVIIMLSLWLLNSMELPEIAFTHYHPFLSWRLPSSCERGQTGLDFCLHWYSKPFETFSCKIKKKDQKTSMARSGLMLWNKMYSEENNLKGVQDQE